MVTLNVHYVVIVINIYFQIIHSFQKYTSQILTQIPNLIIYNNSNFISSYLTQITNNTELTKIFTQMVGPGQDPHIIIFVMCSVSSRLISRIIN